MKVEELMIGDWVSYKGLVSCNVYGITLPEPSENPRFNNMSRITVVLEGLVDVTEEDICPIPITKKILDNNGLLRIEFRHLISVPSPMPNEVRSIMFNGVRIDSVHELQHALRLHGLEYVDSVFSVK